MSEHQPKKCMVNFKNTEEQISIELIYTKRNKGVDIRDFFGNSKEKIPKLEVHFKKGHYVLTDRGQEDVLDMVPEVIGIFQEFYKTSFGEKPQKDDTGASTHQTVLHVSEQKKSEEGATSAGLSDDVSALGRSQRQKEEGTQTESKLGSLGSANRAYSDEDETAAGSENSGDGRVACVVNSDIKNTGTSRGFEQHSDLKEVNKHPNKISDEEHNGKDKKKQKNDSSEGKKKKDIKDGEQNESKHHDRLKEAQKTPSTTRSRTPEHKAELDDKQKAKNDSNGKGEKKKGKIDGEQTKKKSTSQGDDHKDDEHHTHESNDEETGSKGHAESNTTSKMTHENDRRDGDSDRRHAMDAKPKSRDASKERREKSKAEKKSNEELKISGNEATSV